MKTINGSDAVQLGSSSRVLKEISAGLLPKIVPSYFNGGLPENVTLKLDMEEHNSGGTFCTEMAIALKVIVLYESHNGCFVCCVSVCVCACFLFDAFLIKKWTTSKKKFSKDICLIRRDVNVWSRITLTAVPPASTLLRQHRLENDGVHVSWPHDFQSPFRESEAAFVLHPGWVATSMSMS